MNKNVKLLLLNFIVIVMIAVFAKKTFAIPSETLEGAEDVQGSAIALLKRVMRNGIQKIDGVQVSEILNHANQVHLFYRENNVTSSAIPSLYHPMTLRVGGRYNNLIHSGYLDRSLLSQMSGDSSILLTLHEMLEASGYFDHFYSKSIQLYFASRGWRTNDWLDKIIVTRGNRKILGTSLAAGGTSVGGGGDPLAMNVKVITLQKLFQLHESGVESFGEVSLEKLIHLVIDCDVEMSYAYSTLEPLEFTVKDESTCWLADRRDDQECSKFDANKLLPWATIYLSRNSFFSSTLNQDDRTFNLLTAFSRIEKKYGMVCDSSQLSEIDFVEP